MAVIRRYHATQMISRQLPPPTVVTSFTGDGDMQELWWTDQRDHGAAYLLLHDSEVEESALRRS